MPRALANLIGNGVATIAISRWEGEGTADVLNATCVSRRQARLALGAE